MADELQVVWADAHRLAVLCELPEGSQRAIEHNPYAGVLGQPAVLSRSEGDPAVAQADASAAAPTAQDAVAILRGDDRYGPGEIVPQPCVPGPEKKSEAAAFDGGEAPDLEIDPVVGIDEVITRDHVPQRRIHFVEGQCFQCPLGGFVEEQPTARVGGGDLGFLQVAWRNGQSDAGLTLGEWCLERGNQDWLVGQVQFAEDHLAIGGLHGSAGAQQVDLALA